LCVSTLESFPLIPLAPRKMPTTVSVVYTLFKLEELSKEAKAKALEDFCSEDMYPWHKENIASLEAFCERFNVAVKDYSFGYIYGGRNYIKTNVDNNSFRGLKFKEFDFEQMPTGHCMDCTLFKAFQKCWEKTGSAYKAFQNAIEEFLVEVNKDVEQYFSMEGFTSMSEVNEWTYLESGKLFMPDNATIIPSH
jgi:preprotein translocase subunit SecB